MMIFSTMLGRTVFLKWHTRTCLTLFFTFLYLEGLFQDSYYTSGSLYLLRNLVFESLDHGHVQAWITDVSFFLLNFIVRQRTFFAYISLLSSQHSKLHDSYFESVWLHSREYLLQE